jgi:hypothetical protein
MNQGGYFGAYQSGFQTLPKGAYEMMTAPTKQNAETIKNAASAIGSMVQKYADQQAGNEAFQQGSDVQYQDLMSRSQATGVPMNPELAEQYKNIGQMSPQQQAVFNQSMAQEAQRIQSLYGIANQQRQAQQAQGMQQMQRGVSAGLSTVPPINPQLYMPTGQSGMPAFNPLFDVYPQTNTPMGVR